MKDQYGQLAIFQMLSSSPTTVPDANSNIAYGCIRGHKTTVADAIKAYVQSKLKSKHKTWVVIPKELWPDHWHGKYKTPVCVLDKALYGHPEAGGHWERHFRDVIISLGGVAISGHPSTFYFQDTKLLLSAYVDDILLSGPACEHEAFWKRLSEKVNLEPPEELSRFIGREHRLSRIAEGAAVNFDMRDFVQSAVDNYTQLTGQTQLKPASTPFPPEGTLPESGECERGELGDKACSVLMKDLWVARLARPDCQRAITELSTRITKWSRNDDRRLYRLMCYLNSSKEYTLNGHVYDKADDLELVLYCDADFAGSPTDTRSTDGAYLVLSGPNTRFPLAWVSKRQTATSRSTTEAESISLAHSLFGEGMPALSLWEQILGRPMKLRIMEDNQATIKVLEKGFSPKLRHTTRTHRVDIGSVHEALQEPNITLEYVDTHSQAADIFTKSLAPCKWEAAIQMLGVTHSPPKAAK